jgi:transposase-like protein
MKGEFPDTVTQLRIVHQIRNCCKYAVWKDLRPFWAYLREAYRAVNRDAAKMALEKPSNKSHHAVEYWPNDWNCHTSFLTSPWKSERSFTRPILKENGVCLIQNGGHTPWFPNYL